MKRRIVFILLLLAGGAIVNVAVAWGCAVLVGRSVGRVPESWERLPISSSSFGNDPANGCNVLLTRRAGWTRVVSVCLWDQTHEMNPFDDFVLSYWYRVPKSGLDFDERMLPAWSRAAVSHTSDTSGLFEDGFGWPMLSLASCVRATAKEVTSVGSGLERIVIQVPTGLVSDSLADWRYPRVIPFRMLVPGFIINTLFYALLLWLLFFTPFAVRRMLRRRRGLCETCAYPIGVSSVCTECGAAVRPSVARSF